MIDSDIEVLRRARSGDSIAQDEFIGSHIALAEYVVRETLENRGEKIGKDKEWDLSRSVLSDFVLSHKSEDLGWQFANVLADLVFKHAAQTNRLRSQL